MLIAIHEVILYPLFQKYSPYFNSNCKIGIGVFFQILRLVVLMIIEFSARRSFMITYGRNTTLKCMLSDDSQSALSSTLDYRWMVIPQLLHSFSLIAICIGSIEFISAQVPYSMKGLILGTAYGMMFLSYGTFGAAIAIPFTRPLSVWSTGTISCGFWYALLLLVIEVIVCVVLTVLLKLYKKRKREDVLPNEQIFASGTIQGITDGTIII